jgi:small-conductance mechanosensitive channel
MDISSFRDFLDLVVEVWQDGVFGIQISDTLLALLIFGLFMLLRNLFTRVVLGTLHRTTIEQLREIRDRIERYVHDNDEFATPSEVATFVRIDGFSDSSIDILLYCFTRTTVWGDWLEIKERLAYEIKNIVTDAATGFAFPSRSLYLESLPDAPEVFPLSPPRSS